MTYFLNDKRRQELAGKLSEISMPGHLIPLFTDFRDDVKAIDMHLAALTNQMMGYADELLKAQRGEKPRLPIDILGKFMEADQAIIEAYQAEAAERGIDVLPVWEATMETHIKAKQMTLFPKQQGKPN